MSPVRRALLATVLAAAAPGCGLFHNAQRFLHPAEFVVTEPTPTGALVEVEVATGDPRIADGPYVPVATEHGVQPVELSSGGWVRVQPLADDATMRVWVRRTGVVQQGFAPVVTVTGAVRRQLPRTLRPVAGPLGGEARVLYVDDLANTYNDFGFDDGDLLLVEVESPSLAAAEQYWFRHRDLGPRFKGVAGLLVRIPIPVAGAPASDPSPALAIGAAMGYRPRLRRGPLRWTFEQVALVGTVAIGSTSFEQVVGEDQLDDQVNGAFNAALGGGGIEVFDFLSVQVLANLSALFRDANESPATLAVGIDALSFAAFVRDGATRLFRPNTLSEPSD